MITCGVPVGTPTPVNAAASYPGKVSATVGRSGSSSNRWAVVTAKARTAQQQISLADLVPFIDWSPFFHTWEMRGRYPAILENPEARKLFQEAQSLLSRIVEEKLLIARGVYGFFPANSLGDDIELYTDDRRTEVLTTSPQRQIATSLSSRGKWAN